MFYFKMYRRIFLKNGTNYYKYCSIVLFEIVFTKIMKRSLLAILFITAFIKVFSSSSPVNIMYNNEKLILGKNYFSEALNDSISFSKVQFYISNIQYYKEDALVHTVSKKNFLIDLSNTESQMLSGIDLKEVSFDKIKFDVGIDSVTNCSGAYGGDLDPTNGMYWTWQSGYINFKLEGKTKSGLGAQNNFTFHIGGYSYPNNSFRTIELFSKGGNSSIDVSIDQFIDTVNLSETRVVMSPGKKAMDVADLLPSIFDLAK